MNQKDAFLVTKVRNTDVGVELSAATVAVDVDTTRCVDGSMFLSDGTVEEVERLQTDWRLGTKERVQEDALGVARLFARESDRITKLPTPFWLLPVPRIARSEYSVVVKIGNLSLFKTAGFQLSCWSRLVWGTAFKTFKRFLLFEIQVYVCT